MKPVWFITIECGRCVLRASASAFLANTFIFTAGRRRSFFGPELLSDMVAAPMISVMMKSVTTISISVKPPGAGRRCAMGLRWIVAIIGLGY